MVDGRKGRQQGPATHHARASVHQPLQRRRQLTPPAGSRGGSLSMKQDSKRSSSEGQACAAAQAAPAQAHISRLMLLPLAGRLSTREPTPSATETVRVENEPMAAPAVAGGRGAELVGWANPLVHNTSTVSPLYQADQMPRRRGFARVLSRPSCRRLCARPTCSLLLWGFRKIQISTQMAAQTPHAGRRRARCRRL